VSTFQFQDEDIDYLRSIMPHCEAAFWVYLRGLDCSEVKIFAQQEGALVFPREPLIRVEGPLAVGQLLETCLLNLVNFPSLVATNAARMRLAAGEDYSLLEFGLRRAQGPDGGVSASKYAYIGGFDGTSNVTAGKLTNIAVKGTHAHAFVMCYSSLEELKKPFEPKPKDGGAPVNFIELCKEKLGVLGFSPRSTNEGELAAFIAYAQAFPDGFLALVDTFDTINSGIKNFLAVALALKEIGYRANGASSAPHGALTLLHCPHTPPPPCPTNAEFTSHPSNPSTARQASVSIQATWPICLWRLAKLSSLPTLGSVTAVTSRI
jgi:nicotinate phosphoribosyltransferase